MSNLIKFVFLITFTAALGGKVFANGSSEDKDSTEEYNGQEDELPPSPMQWKRGTLGFWSPHPSDYTPMRRPSSSGQGPSMSSKRSDTDIPYHPVPRSMSMDTWQRQNLNNDLENFLEGLRDKRVSPGSFLFMKIGRQTKQQDPHRKPQRSTLPYSLKSGTVKQG